MTASETTQSNNISNFDYAVSMDNQLMTSRTKTPELIKNADDLQLMERMDEEVIEVKNISEYLFVFICSLMVAFGGFVFGWDTGTISGFVNQTDFIRRFGSMNSDGSYYLSDVRTGLIVSIFNIGCAIGGIILSRLGDKYGRRIALMLVVAVYVVGIIIQITCTTEWYQYFVGRIISGLGVGGISVLSPMLISETAPKHLRGTLISCYQLMITCGIFLGYCTNYGTKKYDNSIQWRVPLGLCFVWALFMISGMLFVPESPRYLIEANMIEAARISLAKTNKFAVDDPVITVEVNNIEASVEAERLAGSASWSELFLGKPAMLRRTTMGIMIQSLQQLTGDNYFFYYGTTIFHAVGLDDSFETSIILGLVNFVSTFFSLYTVDRFGRRKCLLWGCIGMITCYLVYSTVGVTSLWPDGVDNDTSSKAAGNSMIVFACLYIFCFATTWAPIAYVVTSESYPLRVRGKAMAIASAANWMWGFLIGFFTPFITSAIQFYYGYVFMGCMVFAYFYVFFFVPETKGLTLEEVNEMYADGVLAWKSSSWIPERRRGTDYDSHALITDDKPWYKRMT